MKIKEENVRDVKFLGVEEAGLFSVGGKYYVKLARAATLESGAEVNAVELGEGGLCDVDIYTKVRDLSGYTLRVEEEQGGQSDANLR